MFGFHPHSVFCYGLLLNMNGQNFKDEKLESVTPLGSRFALLLPIIGLHFRLWGFEPVNPGNLKRLMGKGRSIALVPGGYEEATITTPYEMRVYLKNRKGFVKYALKYGYTIRPVLITNEHKAMSTLDVFTNFRLFINKLKIPTVIFWSKLGLLFPPGIVIHTLIGKGIKGTKSYGEDEMPTHEEINYAHAMYIEEIKRMYEKHKAKNGNAPIAIY
jgi:2-acylglycerol O-acyltransferase 2